MGVFVTKLSVEDSHRIMVPECPDSVNVPALLTEQTEVASEFTDPAAEPIVKLTGDRHTVERFKSLT